LTLYSAYLKRLIPEVRTMRAEIDAEAAHRIFLRAHRRFFVTFWVEHWAMHRPGRGRSASRIISASVTGGSALADISPRPMSGSRSTGVPAKS
jgi:hypothetical protein